MSLTPLGLRGEAYRREAALARIDALAAQKVYTAMVQVFLEMPDGHIEYTYEGWEAQDYEPADPIEEMKRASKEARDYVAAYSTEDAGEPLFCFTVRSEEVYFDAGN